MAAAAAAAAAATTTSPVPAHSVACAFPEERNATLRWPAPPALHQSCRDTSRPAKLEPEGVVATPTLELRDAVLGMGWGTGITFLINME